MQADHKITFINIASVFTGMVWDGGKCIEKYEKYFEEDDRINLEYSQKDWILRYAGTYKTLHEGDVLVRIHKNEVHVLSKEGFHANYKLVEIILDDKIGWIKI